MLGCRSARGNHLGGQFTRGRSICPSGKRVAARSSVRYGDHPAPPSGPAKPPPRRSPHASLPPIYRRIARTMLPRINLAPTVVSGQPIRPDPFVLRACAQQRGPDLNWRPSGYEPGELTDCSTPSPRFTARAPGRCVSITKKEAVARSSRPPPQLPALSSASGVRWRQP